MFKEVKQYILRLQIEFAWCCKKCDEFHHIMCRLIMLINAQDDHKGNKRARAPRSDVRIYFVSTSYVGGPM